MHLRPLLLSLLFSACVATASQAEVRLSPQEARSAAAHYLAGGQPVAARQIANGLLIRDPQDLNALLILSVAERNLGNFKAASKAGKKAWSVAVTDSQKYNAALVVAQALASDGSHTFAQIWLRRAAQTAPSEAEKNIAIRDLQYVRSQNPWSMDFRFSLRPSSNINNGSNSDVVIIGGLPLIISGRNKPLSGMGLVVGGRVEYEKPLSKSKTLRFGGDIETRQYKLSEEAISIAPDAKGSDYAFSSFKLYAAYDFAAPSSMNAHSFEASVGRYRYGGEPLSNLIWLKYSLLHRQESGSILQFSLFTEANSRLDDHARDTGRVLAVIQQRRATESGGIFSWNITASTTNLIGDPKFGRASDLANDAIGGGISYTWAKPFFSATTSLSLQYDGQVFEKSRYTQGEKRVDHLGVATLSMFFDDFEYYGFAPVLDFSYARKYSNAALFSADGFGLGLGFRSSF
ncbi:surface lipoprotein assembly modifier [Falsihalocynthiibacter arcticus]|uniref:Surface lipoprotein assembly modifier C-terminal domain-containing protein n=1 Tax=Falsihalocynthiibacter arcticus TaxID=1579316 RepID=A0A126UV77_9RHOB|nr:surface lipoprotein assembly modifier [Falsihalocynthiibacter arcticus]AML49972.1 hypothetical protein RC74_00570 [Falsihalocynthiibacter arcticus]